ncbi:MAG: proprotein convertase P-domain-containing protein [Robiginitomaculum sp.]|nr:proprotein convertase P-domain-containing protein [Robiginitomaculum sp.]
MLVTHTYRGDIQATLTSPSATTVSLVTNDGGNGLNNYNVRFDDDAGNDVNTAPHNTADGTSAPPYENSVRPLGNMSDFNGENALGTWVLNLCDFYNADSGDFQRANLYFAAITDADLSLTLSASDTTPNVGINVILTYTVINSGPIAATGVTASLPLPSGLSYVSDNGGGDYNSGSNVWTIPGSIADGGTASVQITAFVNTSGSFAITSEISTSSQTDSDSTPGNGDTGEDDYAALTLNPVTPAVPTLSCPGAPSVLDWDIQDWPTASMSNSYTVAGENITITVDDPDGTLLSSPDFGGQTPAESIYDTGGIVPGESDLHFLRNPPNRTSTTDVTIALGTAGTGVAQFQLSIFDVDFGTSQFEDQITVVGTLSGSPVPVTLFTSTANSASGSVVTGNASSTPTQSNGNMTLEFSSAVDTVVINYGNGSGAPANPGNQGISIHDLNFCPVLTAVLGAQKTAAIYDPLSEGLYMIPGNDVIYTIRFTNTGDGAADADSVVIIDAIPPEIEFYNGDIDDGGPETTAVTGTDNGSGLTFNYASDVAYSNAGSPPANFAACGYTPSAGYDPAITYLCVNPSGVMVAGDPDPSFDVKFRARIK